MGDREGKSADSPLVDKETGKVFRSILLSFYPPRGSDGVGQFIHVVSATAALILFFLSWNAAWRRWIDRNVLEQDSGEVSTWPATLGVEAQAELACQDEAYHSAELSPRRKKGADRGSSNL
jgi:hypothetical protein